MIRTLLCSTALLIAAPAIAQTATPAQEPMQTAPAAPATPAAPADQAAPAAPAQEATPAAPQQAAPAEPAAATSVAAIVDSEFPAYDADKSGQLEKAEFGKWMLALKDQEMKSTGKSMPPAEVTAWADGAFTTADADKSTSVTKAELVTFLSGGAA